MSFLCVGIFFKAGFMLWAVEAGARVGIGGELLEIFIGGLIFENCPFCSILQHQKHELHTLDQ